MPKETTARSPKIRVFASTVIAGIVNKIVLKISLILFLQEGGEFQGKAILRLPLD